MKLVFLDFSVVPQARTQVIRVTQQAPLSAEPAHPPCPTCSPFPLTHQPLAIHRPSSREEQQAQEELLGDSYPLHPDAATLQGVSNERWLLGQSRAVTVAAIQLEERKQRKSGMGRVCSGTPSPTHTKKGSVGTGRDHLPIVDPDSEEFLAPGFALDFPSL